MGLAKDLLLARKANQHGAKFSLRIVREAQRAGMQISLLFAFIEQESEFANIFGHDPTSSVPPEWKGGEVTEARYKMYRTRRQQGGGCQGVGPMQLTYYGYQDKADSYGGCWIPKYNIRCGAEVAAGLMKSHGNQDTGIAAYNGVGPAAEQYAKEVRSKQKAWHFRLT